MAALTLTSEARDRICLKVFTAVYSSCDANQQALVDGGGNVPGTPTGGEAKAAYDVVNQWAQAYGMTGTNLPPTVWEGWLVALTAYGVAQTYRPERSQYFARSAQVAFTNSINTFSTAAADASALQNHATTIAGIRGFVLDHCARLKPPILPSIASIDDHTQWALNTIWNRAFWNFRKRQVTITIPTSGNPTFDLTSPETFAAMSSRLWYYTDIPNTSIQVVNADPMSQSLAYDASSYASTARPVIMRVQDGGNATYTWYFSPSPDKQYTAKGEVFVAGPGTPSSATDTTIFNKFPPPFLPVIKDVVLARVLSAYAASDKDAEARAFESISQLLPQFEDQGYGGSTQVVRDVYEDPSYQRGYNGVGGAM